MTPDQHQQLAAVVYAIASDNDIDGDELLNIVTGHIEARLEQL